MIIHAERIRSVVAHVETEVIETFWSFLGCATPNIRTVIRVCVQTDDDRTLGKFEVDPAKAQDVLNDLLSQIPSALQDDEDETEDDHEKQEEEEEEAQLQPEKAHEEDEQKNESEIQHAESVQETQ